MSRSAPGLSFDRRMNEAPIGRYRGRRLSGTYTSSRTGRALPSLLRSANRSPERSFSPPSLPRSLGRSVVANSDRRERSRRKAARDRQSSFPSYRYRAAIKPDPLARLSYCKAEGGIEGATATARPSLAGFMARRITIRVSGGRGKQVSPEKPVPRNHLQLLGCFVGWLASMAVDRGDDHLT